jgi:hypothetical protein
MLSSSAGVSIMSQSPSEPLILGNLLHLSFNMWEDAQSPTELYRKASPKLRFDEALWAELTQRMADKGLNMVVLDLGDGVRYDSHPEIAVEGAWSPQRLRDEAARLKQMGLELIPKLNFSTCHDEWLGPYSRCVSTPVYYQVCQELIAEVSELLRPRFFHLGLDEETPQHQRNFSYAVIRQHELIWHDMLFYFEQVRRHGVRPWIWSDFIWHHEEAFLKRMPHDVLQSNWYYGPKFEFAPDSDEPSATYTRAYRTLESAGYDQIPTCSNHSNAENTGLTVEYARKWITPAHLKGFLQTPWRPTLPQFRDHHLQAIDLLADAAAK